MLYQTLNFLNRRLEIVFHIHFGILHAVFVFRVYCILNWSKFFEAQQHIYNIYINLVDILKSKCTHATTSQTFSTKLPQKFEKLKLCFGDFCSELKANSFCLPAMQLSNTKFSISSFILIYTLHVGFSTYLSNKFNLYVYLFYMLCRIIHTWCWYILYKYIYSNIA